MTFTPADLFGSFAPSLGVVVEWVAAGVAAAVGLYFALLGIRKGLAFFFSIVGGRGGESAQLAPDYDHEMADSWDLFSDEFVDSLNAGVGIGMYNRARYEMRVNGRIDSFNAAEQRYLLDRYGED